MDEKSLSLLFPVGVGAVVTNNWCITSRSSFMHLPFKAYHIYSNNRPGALLFMCPEKWHSSDKIGWLC